MSTVLLLEDEPALANMYARKLFAAGHVVILSKTAEEALEEASQKVIDFVIVDHGIKGHGLSGLDILPELRSTLPNGKIIMLSNYSRAQLAESSLSQGADDFLLKIDTSPDSLVQYIES